MARRRPPYCCTNCNNVSPTHVTHTPTRLRQGVLEKALSQRFQTYVPVVAAGRTDTGVHSVGQAIHFDLPNADEDLGQLTYSMNQMMPEVRLPLVSVVEKHNDRWTTSQLLLNKS